MTPTIGISSTPGPLLSRYKTDGNDLSAYELNSRDRRIIELVHSHRFLDTELLWYLMQVDTPEAAEKRFGKDGKLRPVRNGFGLQALYRRLQLLYQTGYLERHYASDQPMGRSAGSPRAIYGIGPKSAVPLAERLGTPVHQIRQTIEANKVKSPFLRHALDTARFRVTLELACKNSKGRVRLLSWEQGLHLRDWVTGRNELGHNERFCVYPDAFLALAVAGNRRVHYFLEVDRGTEPIVSSSRRSDIRKKLMGYRYYRKCGQFRKRYSYLRLSTGEVGGIRVSGSDSGSPPIPPEDAIPGFSVLFVITGNAVPDDPTTGRITNILLAMCMFGEEFKTTNFFWFSTMAAFSLQQPHGIFARVWRTAHPEKGLQSLIE
jgi:hypothetical protein